MNGTLFYRFLLVGVINTIIGLGIMFLLLHIGFSYWISTFLGNCIGACTSYFLNKSFTFRSKKSLNNTIFRFFLVIGICYFAAYFIGIRIATTLIGQIAILPLIYVEDIAILLGTALYTILNFVGQKQFVFSK